VAYLHDRGLEPALATVQVQAHAGSMAQNFRQSLDDLERSVRVSREKQVATQDAEPLREYVAPEDLDRMRLLADPAGAGRLNPRG
jgi:hypothetical protein